MLSPSNSSVLFNGFNYTTERVNYHLPGVLYILTLNEFLNSVLLLAREDINSLCYGKNNL